MRDFHLSIEIVDSVSYGSPERGSEIGGVRFDSGVDLVTLAAATKE
jgi:hypothetical protein